MKTRQTLVLLGPPACGKGTQAQRIAHHLGGIHISSGFLLREAVARQTPLGKRARRFVDKGELVPDDLVLELVEEKLMRTGDGSSVILDGFPRTVAQALALDDLMPPDRVVLIELDNAEVVLRISGRRVGPDGVTYHVLYDPPPPGVAAMQRSDDREEVIRERLEVYRRQTQPLLDYYDRRELLHRVSGKGTVEEVFDRIAPLLKT